MKIDTVALVEILRSEKESYQELLALAERQQELIIAHDVDRLSEVLRATEALIARVGNLEEQRLALFHTGSVAGSPRPPHTLSSVIESLDDDAAGEITRLRNEILGLIDDLITTNKTNAELVYRSIGYIDFLLDTLSPDEDLCYGRTAAQGSRAMLFDGRA